MMIAVRSILTLWICVKGADVAVNPGILLKAAVSAANDPMVRKAAAAAAQLAAENKDQIKEVVDKVAPVVKKAADEGAAAGAKAAGFFRARAADAAKAVGGAGSSAVDAVKQAAEKRSEEKSLANARKRLLEGASFKMTAVDFEAAWRKADEDGSMKPLACPGYVVFATYKNKLVGNAFHDYKEVFVVRSEDMGASVYRCLKGVGNPDVYADYRSGDHVLLFGFPDLDFDDDNEATLDGFITALGAGDSYSARAASFSQDSQLSFRVSGYSAEVQRAIEALRASFGEVDVCIDEMHGGGVVEVAAKVAVAG